MKNRIKTWWERLGALQQTMWAAGLILILGFTIGATFKGKIGAYWVLPDSVGAQGVRLDSVESLIGPLASQVGDNIQSLDSLFVQLESLFEKVDSVVDVSGRTWCVVRAEALGLDPYHECTLGLGGPGG